MITYKGAQKGTQHQIDYQVTSDRGIVGLNENTFYPSYPGNTKFPVNSPVVGTFAGVNMHEVRREGNKRYIMFDD